LAALKTLVGWLSLLFHSLFCLLLIVLGAFALASGPRFIHLEMLPWTGRTLVHILIFGGLFGLLSLTLAAFGKLRFLFLIWTAAVALLLTKTLIFSGYRFPPGEWRRGIYLVAAAWFTTLGAFFLLGAKPAPGPRKYRVK